ncbi:poly-beta-1,6 N-acetyl-D-glucosamine export porin PgaA, partial [Nitrospira defluvii]|nr:poly-beta-1,6 N-acetyl-D-glucosamine export porin PgaA [Nitrospira defluvii]
MKTYPSSLASRIVWLSIGLMTSIGFSGLLHAADLDKTRYEKALDLARDGQHEAALPMLKALTEQYPEEKTYLYDYIAVLGWAEKDEAVLSYQTRAELESAPPYVLEVFGRSARNLKNFQLAIRFYKMAREKAPKSLESNIGLALSLAESGETEKGIAILEVLDKRHPKQIDILESLAYAYRLGKKQIEALSVYQQILEIDPNHRESKRQRILIVSRMGAPHLAASMAQESPELFNSGELEEITGDQAAQSIRWGGLYTPPSEDPFHDTDTAIFILQDQLEHLEARGEVDSVLYRRARLDLMVALRDRQRFKEVIAIYDELKEHPVENPNYILRAVADAYMHEKKPDAARDLYLKILERTPDDFNTKISLFYAYFDTGQYRAGLELINTLADEEKNPGRKLNAESVAIMGDAWSSQLRKAQDRIEPLVARAPNNPYLQGSLGYIYLWRGWPRRAKEVFQLSKAIEPEVLDAHLGEIGSARDLHEYRQADEKIEGLKRQYPDNNQVKRLTRDWKVHNMRELYVEVSHGQSSGVQEGSKDFSSEVTLYSRPIDHHFRVFAQGYYEQADFSEGEGTGRYRRYGAGVEYRVRDVTLVGTLSTGYGRDEGIGLRLNGSWMPNDFWIFAAHVDTYSNGVPLRGRLNEDVDGWSVGLNTDYRFHESRAVGVGLEFLDFSDTNERLVYFAALSERIIVLPAYKLDGRLGLYGSTNSLDAVDASYYNPNNDLSVELTLTNEWPLYRYYKISVIHRLGGSIGNYYQSGIGSEGFWGFQYEHQWGITDQ